ncbi:TPA: DUF1378 family protein [Escherichia coli]|nr:DUF1378 family protein [Escherichia coli]HEC5088772.1 DUF1378 family protein [Escherichia coli]
MTFLQLILLYFCTVVCALYLVSGAIRLSVITCRVKIDAAAAEKVKASAAASSAVTTSTTSATTQTINTGS